jgi:hypothetical protein
LYVNVAFLALDDVFTLFLTSLIFPTARANNYAPDFIVALLLLPCLRTITIANDYYDNQQLINQEIMPCRDETLTWIENMISNVSRHRNGWCCIVYV